MRDLDELVLVAAVSKVSGFLTTKALRFTHQGITMVAKKTPGGRVKIITCWPDKRGGLP